MQLRQNAFEFDFHWSSFSYTGIDKSLTTRTTTAEQRWTENKREKFLKKSLNKKETFCMSHGVVVTLKRWAGGGGGGSTKVSPCKILSNLLKANHSQTWSRTQRVSSNARCDRMRLKVLRKLETSDVTIRLKFRLKLFWWSINPRMEGLRREDVINCKAHWGNVINKIHLI